MREKAIRLIIVLILTASTPCNAALRAELQDACTSLATTLMEIHGGKVAKTIGTIMSDDEQHYGCTITLHGDSSKGSAAIDPPERLRPVPHSGPYLAGWRTDPSHDADGPDGTAFRMTKDGIVCMVEGRWDGGEDGNPSDVPSPLYETIVRCWDRTK